MLLQRLQRLRLQPPGAITGVAVAAAVDVQALVLALRRQRRGMVQTGNQYELVYHALVDDLKDGIRAGQEMMLFEAEAEREESERGKEGGGGNGGNGGGGGGGNGAGGGKEGGGSSKWLSWNKGHAVLR
jgi:hypothetical protein